MQNDQKVLFLSLYTFGLTGGIEKVCRCVTKVLTSLKAEHVIKDFNALSMYDAVADVRYVPKSNFKGFNGNRIKFCITAILKALKSDTLIMSHINLLFLALIIKKIKPKTRIILFAHGIEIWGRLAFWKRNFLQHQVEIWAVSRYTATQITEQHHVPASKISVINNCLEPFFNIPKAFGKPSYLTKRYNLDEHKQLLFTLARLSAQEQYKGYDLVLAAMKDLPTHIHYLLAGQADAIEENRIAKLITAYGLNERVTLTGYIADEELTDHFLLADVLVMPSQGEGFGISFIEAAACGCKIIAGNADGSKDALLDGTLGALVDPLDTEALKTTILTTLQKAGNPENQQAHALYHFSFSKYKTLIGKHLLLNE